MKWLLAAFLLLMIGGQVAHILYARKLEQSTLKAASNATLPFELDSSDLVQARTQELVRTVPVSGSIRAVNSTVVKAKVAAEVKSLTVREGDSVTSGQTIGQLDTTELEWRVRQADQTAQSAKAQLDIAKRALENNRALVTQGFISATGLETSVSNDAAAQATYRSAYAAAELARKALADAKLIAPISGQISQRFVQPGERVATDARLIEIVDLARLEMEAAIAPEEVGEIEINQAARLHIDGLDHPIMAKVARLNPSTQAGSRMVMIYLAIAQHSGLRQGIFAKGNIEIQRKAALLVPTNVVRVDQAKPYVLTVKNDKVTQQWVTLGTRGQAAVGDALADERENVVELTSGVTEGALLLRGTLGTVSNGTSVRIVNAPLSPAASAQAPKLQ